MIENANFEHMEEGVSIIIPFLNEEDGIELCCSTMDSYAEKQLFPIEAIFVDDGSRDNSVRIIQNYSFNFLKSVKLISLSKNYGSHAAIRAGIKNATYDICTWMGSDLQEPMELINMSHNEIKNGYDAVYVEKKTIKVSPLNRMFSKIYSSLMRKYAVASYASGGISTIVFNKKIMKYLNDNIESNSSIMLQIMDAGFKYKLISLDYKERAVGVSKWTLQKKIKLFIDSFVAFSFMPIRLVSIIGIVIFIIGLVIGISTIINRLVNPFVPIGYSTLASIMALGFGVTNISLGIIAEYLWRAYDAARKRPAFIISEVTDIKKPEEDVERQKE